MKQTKLQLIRKINVINKISKKMICLMLTVIMAAGCLITDTVMARAAAATFVYEGSDMIGQGGYIYFIRNQEDSSTATICRKRVSDGKVSKVATEQNGVIRLVVSGQYLYYTTSDDSGWLLYMCRLDGSDARVLCTGMVCYADAANVYGIEELKNGKEQLFCIAPETGEKQKIKTVSARQTLSYIGNIGSDSYYYMADNQADKVYLYRLGTINKKQLVRVAAEKRIDKDSDSPLMISDVAQSGGELYYDFGSYEGTGRFWYGTIRKLTTDGKKKTVAKSTGDDRLVIGSRALYFSTPKGDNYKYQLSTEKKSKYSLALQKGIDYTILGDKTYMADTSNAKTVTISRFNSGTDRETLTKNFITIPFKQKKKVSYSVTMKQIGIYNLVCVTGIDFTDQSYGWRGKLTSMNWYITDGAGTVLGSFK